MSCSFASRGRRLRGAATHMPRQTQGGKGLPVPDLRRAGRTLDHLGDRYPDRQSARAADRRCRPLLLREGCRTEVPPRAGAWFHQAGQGSHDHLDDAEGRLAVPAGGYGIERELPRRIVRAKPHHPKERAVKGSGTAPGGASSPGSDFGEAMRLSRCVRRAHGAVRGCAASQCLTSRSGWPS